MLDVQLFDLHTFLPKPYEEALLPRLKKAHEKLQTGTGLGGEFTGWVHLPQAYDREEFARIQAAAKKIQSDSQALVVIGIGGSYLGARGVIDCLCSPNYNLKKKETPNVYFVGNGLSGDALSEVLDLVRDVDFSVNIISKSGTTTEPAVAFRFFRELLEEKYGKEEAGKRIYATTDKARGALKSLADAEGWETFVVPDDIGGRYSVLTAVGLLPIAVTGVDVEALMEGAAEMMNVCADGSYDSPAWQYAALRYELYRAGYAIEILGCYDPAFRFMTEWWKQLYGESEGKDGKGLFPASVEFTADLHSMGQYIQEGRRILFETIVRLGASDRQLAVPRDETDGDGLNFLAGASMDHIRDRATEGTLLAHSQGGVPNVIVNVGGKGPRELGRLIYFFEYACGLSGYLLDVNPFDQPGVEDYKQNMFALLGKPEGVWATLDRQRGGSRIDDYSLIVLEYPGIRAQLRAGMLVREPGPRFAVYGTDGAYVKYGLDPQEDALRHRGAKPAPGDWCTEDPSKWGVLHDEHGRRAYPTVTGNYMRFYDRVRDTLREGKAPAVTHEQMLWDMQILEAAFESDRTGSTIRL